MVIAKPILREYSDDYYSRIVVDANGTTHYWNNDGSYDGWTRECSTTEAKIVSEFLFHFTGN